MPQTARRERLRAGRRSPGQKIQGLRFDLARAIVLGFLGPRGCDARARARPFSLSSTMPSLRGIGLRERVIAQELDALSQLRTLGWRMRASSCADPS